MRFCLDYLWLCLSLSNKLNSGFQSRLGGSLWRDHTIYPDCRPEFYQKLNDAFDIGNWDSDKVELNLPYIDGDKTTILQDAIISCEQLHLDFDFVFANTNTSYEPDKEGEVQEKPVQILNEF